MSEIDQQFIEYVVKSLVGKPDAVHIDRRIDEKGVLLELTVDPEDLGSRNWQARRHGAIIAHAFAGSRHQKRRPLQPLRLLTTGSAVSRE
jgi:hypothetical protein